MSALVIKGRRVPGELVASFRLSDVTADTPRGSLRAVLPIDAPPRDPACPKRRAKVHCARCGELRRAGPQRAQPQLPGQERDVMTRRRWFQDGGGT